MIFERGLDAVNRRKDSILTVGTFDGVHLGHRAIIQDLIQRAREVGGFSTLVTFDPHPREILWQQPPPKLTTLQERKAILSSLGLDRMVVLPFTREFSELSAEDFVTQLLIGSIGMKIIVVGHDHRFGKGRTGDVDLLTSLGKQHNFDVGVIGAHRMGDTVVSSRILRSIVREKGDVALAAKLLQRPYSLTGEVIHGDSRGRELNYPTANLRPIDSNKLIPHYGIYVVSVQISGTNRGGMMSIGTRPAIRDSTGVHLEVHLFDFDGNLYGKELTVHFIERVRDEKGFDSLQELQAAMLKDEYVSRKILEQAQLPIVLED